MTTFLINVLALKVFDEEGKFVTKLDKATKGKLEHSSSGSYFGINIVNFDLDLVKAIGEVVESNDLSDFDKELSPQKTKIVFKAMHSHLDEKYFKLVAEGELHNAEGDVSHDFKLIIHEARLISGLGFEVKLEDFTNLNGFGHVFNITEDSNGNSFELELTER